jgi:hypothetical protein
MREAQNSLPASHAAPGSIETPLDDTSGLVPSVWLCRQFATGPSVSPSKHSACYLFVRRCCRWKSAEA